MAEQMTTHEKFASRDKLWRIYWKRFEEIGTADERSIYQEAKKVIDPENAMDESNALMAMLSENLSDSVGGQFSMWRNLREIDGKFYEFQAVGIFRYKTASVRSAICKAFLINRVYHEFKAAEEKQLCGISFQ